jgi:predicted enzyme related to lactoylglutathione lyase
MGIFPHKDVGCALCFGQGYKPNQDGVLVYMNAEPNLEVVLDRVESAGGKVISEKKLISSEYGFTAVFVDSEGNRAALHSSN